MLTHTGTTCIYPGAAGPHPAGLAVAGMHDSRVIAARSSGLRRLSRQRRESWGGNHVAGAAWSSREVSICGYG